MTVGITYPRGFRAGTAACGIKAFTAGASAMPEPGGETSPQAADAHGASPPAVPPGGRDDLAVIFSDRPCEAGGIFTTNRVKSAAVVICQLHLQQNRVRAITVNSGNANACTGAQGFRDALQTAKLTADRLDLDPPQVLVCSTGVIGRYLPMEAMKHGIRVACGSLSDRGGEAASTAIMTTDTVSKTAQVQVEIAGTPVRVGGMCKGSGMIHPNMATMLAFVTTDAAVEPGLMAQIARRVGDRSFNQVTVDGDSSTNDTFLVLANGAAGNRPVAAGTPEAAQLEAAVLEVARGLARKIAQDGEGATKLITVRIEGAPDDVQARLAARAVASSSLVKTAIHGGDPNWGRIVCALGYSGCELAIDTLTVEVAGVTVFDRGAGVEADLDRVRQGFEQPEIEIRARLGMGDGRAEAWGCDLSAEYVRINAEYTT